MSIIELLQKAGVENVKVQSVASDLVEADCRNPHAATITVATSHEMASAVSRESGGVSGSHVGLLVWVPRDKI